MTSAVGRGLTGMEIRRTGTSPRAVAPALGVSLLGERPGSAAAAGLLLILVGAWFATERADEFRTPFRSL